MIVVLHEARRQSVAQSFAELTALLEDMHGLAVEGQHDQHPFEFYLVLAHSLEASMTAAAIHHASIMARIGNE